MRHLAIDLEVSKRTERIVAFAAVDSKGASVVRTRLERGELYGALQELDRFAAAAEVILGHNLIHFDLPHLRAAAPDLRLLRRPALDTLMLSPLAFPKNPYHRLIKHDRDGDLIRERRSDPEYDARLSLDLFEDERAALGRAEPDRLLAWHWLTSGERDCAAFDGLFRELRGSARPTGEEAKQAIDRLLAGKACTTRGSAIVSRARGWPFAYVLAWLSVAGANSVMPPWVRHQFPKAGELLAELRDRACNANDCGWCREMHDARHELRRWFGFKDFRDEPAMPDGSGSMQRAIVERAMAGGHVLGLLPTGGGKSLCYQVPALSRYHKTGALTVVISPLVALMADQVAGLQNMGIGSVVTVNGMLSMPERSDALDRIRLGDAAIVLTSPEQLRNPGVVRAIQQREIGSWVLDEAHCLSSWGHDFRPDYRYVGRFIREHSGERPAPIICLTATAKPAVREDIVRHFREEVGIELEVFDGGARRDNLTFEVVPTSPAEKFAHIDDLLHHHLPADTDGGAIVYCSTRRRCEEVADYLVAKHRSAAYFHAGLQPERKKQVQEDFIEGRLAVIVATNAFGMGVDKPDVRLVVHADIPGSLENYLQEAGRAGRDAKAASCVLLYTADDVERQFGLAARSRLTRSEIDGICRALRNLKRKNDRSRRGQSEVVATPGEILLEDDEHAFARDSHTDDTRIKTAIAWLEDARLVQRDENRAEVFASSLLVSTLDEAKQRLTKIDERQRPPLVRIVERLINAPIDEGVSTDELISLSGLTRNGVRNALHDLEQLGIANNDTTLTAYIHEGIEGSSLRRLEGAIGLEQALVGLLRESAPDLDAKAAAATLHLRPVTQALKDDGHEGALPLKVLRLLRSISMDGRGDDGPGSIDLRQQDRDQVSVKLNRDWPNLLETARRRRSAAGVLLQHLREQLKPGVQAADILVETTLGKLLASIESDLEIRSWVKDTRKLLDRALLWLHEQEIIRLNKGLAVFRPAMTIRVENTRRRFGRTDFAPLDLHYREQVLQIHVMEEFVNRGLDAIAEALRLAMDYFILDRDEFLKRWLPERKDLARQTTPESWRTIVESLNNPAQRRIVADDRQQTNVLVLAGPGSGKTRVLVHRIAYLLRVRREDPRSILALAYNRHAAVEIRRRLNELVGADSRGVTVLTCHGMALRLTGTHLATRPPLADNDFAELLQEATALLRGEGLPQEEADEQREQLLAGFRWILVDEYQDVDEEQYQLISALAGRTLSDGERKLTLFAVGDDDQNIYSYAGASVKYLRQFEEDYKARTVYLTDNYRSTAHIIDAANAWIAVAQERMKIDHPIVIDRSRRREPRGGQWESRDTVCRGRVQVLRVRGDNRSQAMAALAELRRLAELMREWDWRRCAVIARTWHQLDPLRSLCERDAIPVQVARDDVRFFWRLREVRRLRDWLGTLTRGLVDGHALRSWLAEQRSGEWSDVLAEAIDEYLLETGGAETSVQAFNAWLAEWGRELRRRQTGLLLLTAHRAKGLEFDHVVILDGGWGMDETGYEARPSDDVLRLYYVAMTRARETLTLLRSVASTEGELRDAPWPAHRGRDYWSQDLPALMARDHLIRTAPPPELDVRYEPLQLKDVDIGFAGQFGSKHPAHRAIGSLRTGDALEVRATDRSWLVADSSGQVVGQLARDYHPPPGLCRARVHAIVTWDKADGTPTQQARALRDSWEVVLPELIYNTRNIP
ncbi:MAG: RecQ family ATP-dependent DNA helicase [Gammaproteobacteria bacterium]|nr:RecQ family ATP-dependent DNA helicase [Gammaproteobacteria bacterium]